MQNLCCAQVTALDEGAAGISGVLSLTGAEFSEMSPAAQADAVARLNVFSRVEPSHKSLLVDRLRQQVPTLLPNLIYQPCQPVVVINMHACSIR